MTCFLLPITSHKLYLHLKTSLICQTTRAIKVSYFRFQTLPHYAKSSKYIIHYGMLTNYFLHSLKVVFRELFRLTHNWSILCHVICGRCQLTQPICVSYDIKLYLCMKFRLKLRRNYITFFQHDIKRKNVKGSFKISRIYEMI